MPVDDAGDVSVREVVSKKIIDTNNKRPKSRKSKLHVHNFSKDCMPASIGTIARFYHLPMSRTSDREVINQLREVAEIPTGGFPTWRVDEIFEYLQLSTYVLAQPELYKLREALDYHVPILVVRHASVEQGIAGHALVLLPDASQTNLIKVSDSSRSKILYLNADELWSYLTATNKWSAWAVVEKNDYERGDNLCTMGYISQNCPFL